MPSPLEVKNHEDVRDVKLTAVLCHEMSEPLSYLLANLHLVLSELDRACRRVTDQSLVKAEHCARRADDCATHLARLVRDVRGRVHAEADTLRPVELGPLLHAATFMVECELEKRAHLVREYRIKPVVMGNPARLSKVFVHLLSRALRALPEGHPEHHRVTVRLDTFGPEHVVVDVSHTGAAAPTPPFDDAESPPWSERRTISGRLDASIVTRIVGTLDGVIELPCSGNHARVILPLGAPHISMRSNCEQKEATRASGSARTGRRL